MPIKTFFLTIGLLCLCLQSSCLAEEDHPPVPLDNVSTKSNEQGTVARRPLEFQGDEIGQVLRLLARQAKIDLVVSEKISGTITMRLQNSTAFGAIEVIVRDKNLVMKKVDGTFFIEPGPGYIPSAQSGKDSSETSLFSGNQKEMGILSFGYGLLGMLIGYGTLALFIFGFIHLVGSLCTAFTEAGKAISPSFIKRLGFLLLLGAFAATIARRNSASTIQEK